MLVITAIVLIVRQEEIRLTDGNDILIATENSDLIRRGSEVKEPLKIIPEETFIDIRISFVGDVMGHSTQIESAYDASTDTYDFTSVFEDVRPFIQEADLAIANLETTLAGERLPYRGYPLFNTPDAIIDALDYAGFDTIITTNNHSLDTRAEGLRRTVEVINDKGLDPVGTFESAPESRVLFKDVKGIKVAILAYTEHLNGLDAHYSNQQVDDMVNVISENRILTDVAEAQAGEPDLIITYMHWGPEYADEPNDFQRRYANLLNEAGVDIIIGSHPHVIQEAGFIEGNEQLSFVAYSLGNFISNQRVETLGEHRAPTEDGVILSLDVQKNEQTNETTIQHVDYTPTWVYRDMHEGDATYTYRILPITSALEQETFSDGFAERMRHSLQETSNRLSLD